METILFHARGLNRDRCIPLCTTFSRLALGTELRRLNGLCYSNLVVYLPQSGDRLRRSVTICILNHCFSCKIKDNGTQKVVQRQRMGMLLCEQNFRDVWSRNESVRA